MSLLRNPLTIHKIQFSENSNNERNTVIMSEIFKSGVNCSYVKTDIFSGFWPDDVLFPGRFLVILIINAKNDNVFRQFEHIGWILRMFIFDFDWSFLA